MIESFAIDPSGQLAHHGSDLSTGTWINVQAPTTDEIQTLVAHYQLPADYITSALKKSNQPRVEGLESDHTEKPLFIFLQCPRIAINALGYNTVETVPVGVVMTDHTVLTICRHPLAIFRQNIFAPDATLFSADHLEDFVLHLVFSLTQAFVDETTTTYRQARHLEGHLASATKNDQLYRIMAMQKSLIFLQTGLKRNSTVLYKLEATAKYFTDTDQLELVQDIMNENAQAAATIELQSALIDQYSQMVSSVVSNNLNEIMKFLTSITIILTIPTIIGGIYGMNVNLPGAHLAAAFTWIMLGTIGLCIVVTEMLRHRNFL